MILVNMYAEYKLATFQFLLVKSKSSFTVSNSISSLFQVHFALYNLSMQFVEILLTERLRDITFEGSSCIYLSYICIACFFL